MFTVYILFSKQLQKYYVGYSSKSAQDRLKEHLYNHKGFTAKAKDWNIIYRIEMNSKSEALMLERKIKKRGAKRFLNEIASRQKREGRRFESCHPDNKAEKILNEIASR